MKQIKFEDLLRDTIAKYNAFNNHLVKCNSAFSLQLFLDYYQLTSKSCDFGTWFFSQKSSMDLPTLNELEAPYIKIYKLYKLLEIRNNAKLSKMDRLKKRLPFVKSEPNLTVKLVEELEIQSLLFVHNLKKTQEEYKNYQASNIKLKSKLELLEKIEAKDTRTILETELETTKSLTKTQTVPKKAQSIVSIQASKHIEKQDSQSNSNIKTARESDSIPDNIKNFENRAILKEAFTNHYKLDSSKKNDTSHNSSSNVNTQEWNSLLAMKKMMDSL
jgi:hypothetical protein